MSYGQSPYGGGLSSTNTAVGNSADSPLEKIRALSATAEDYIDTYTQPIKPHLPALGRFLIVVTFLEDALRIVTQWGDQLYYLQKHRGFPWGLSHLFLMTNVIVSTTTAEWREGRGIAAAERQQGAEILQAE